MKRLILCVLTLTLAIAASAQPCCGEQKQKNIQPPFLKPGDKIAIISPSYTCNRTAVDTAAIVLREWGYEPVLGANIDSLYRGKYAGTAEQRLADLRAAIEDPEIKAIICSRGGYGTIHLADMMDCSEFAYDPKWLVGFSDITTLLAMETCGGVMGIHGTIGSYIAKVHGTDSSSVILKDLLEGTVPEYELPSTPLNMPGEGTGMLVGGNICTITPLLGSAADPTLEGDLIIFIEEVEESYHNIDRLFNMLILSGAMDRCKGVILGQFSDCGADLEWDSVEQMLCSYLEGRGIPVICGFPAGHDHPNLPLIMGAQTTIKVTENKSTITFDVKGRKKKVYAN